jgi:hypothetical protein
MTTKMITIKILPAAPMTNYNPPATVKMMRSKNENADAKSKTATWPLAKTVYPVAWIH